MNKINKLEELIEKHKNGSINQSELQELSSFLNGSDNVYEKEELYRKIWNTSQSTSDNINTSRIWRTIQLRIEPKTNVPSGLPGRKKNLARRFSYAAITILFLALSVYLYETKQLPGPSPSSSIAAPGIIEYSVPYGSKSELLLSDGTQIWLNSGSKIRFHDDFSQKTRTVYLEGEAFFEVAKNKEVPFYVKTPHLNIKVFGTSFNVKAFKEEDLIETTLITGSVMLEKTDDKGNIIKKLELKPNQMASYSSKLGKITITAHELNEPKKLRSRKPAYIETKNQELLPEIKMAIAWKDNLLTFKGEDIDNLILKLQRWYNVEIVLKNDKLRKCRFTGAFDNETIEQALEALKLTTPFSYSMHENKIVIY
jgi:transmembrane sensor